MSIYESMPPASLAIAFERTAKNIARLAAKWSDIPESLQETYRKRIAWLMGDEATRTIALLSEDDAAVVGAAKEKLEAHRALVERVIFGIEPPEPPPETEPAAEDVAAAPPEAEDTPAD